MLAAMTERLERRVPMGEVDRYNVRRGIWGRQRLLAALLEAIDRFSD
jgi:hypothetical protein